MAQFRVRSRRSRALGFTLIELMLVVAIIGVLSSIAIPAFIGFRERAFDTEMTVMVESLKRTILEDYDRRNGFPESWGGGWSNLSTNPNPPWPYGSGRKPWQKGVWGWDKVAFEPDGFLRFHYMVNGWAGPGANNQYLYIYVIRDMDDDGNSRWDYFGYTRNANGHWYEYYRWTWEGD